MGSGTVVLGREGREGDGKEGLIGLKGGGEGESTKSLRVGVGKRVGECECRGWVEREISSS